MANVLLFGDGLLKVQGFATVYGREADTEVGIELIRRGAFAASLRSGENVVATWGHDHYFTWARTADETLKLWESPSGLCFEAAVECSMRGRGLADFVAGGHAVASITLTPIDYVKTAIGREISRADLTEICIFHAAAYPTACWLGGDAQPPNSLTPRAEALRLRWTAERQAQQAPATPAASARPRVHPARRAQPAMSFEEYAGPPPRGMSVKDWEWFADMEAAGRRAMRPPRRAR